MSNNRQRYKKKDTQYVVAVQLDLDTGGFTYTKWGGQQQCKPGDWIVDNNGEIYTVDSDVFTQTYRGIGQGKFVKTTPVWAELASQSGILKTKEGKSHFNAGDYLVFNNQDGTDGYCMSAETFNAMYELDNAPEAPL
jgi:hypothetical protein